MTAARAKRLQSMRTLESLFATDAKLPEISKALAKKSHKKKTPADLYGYLKPALFHPYPKAKGVKIYDGVRVMEPNGSRVLVIPLYIKDEIVGIHYIDELGNKNLLGKEKGGRKKGASFQVGNGSGDVVFLCEGYATAASVFETTGSIVYMCVDAGNLKPAAENLRQQYPDHEFIFCADNDTDKPQTDKGYNVGFIDAVKAARAVGNSKVIMPEQPGYDFNDLHQKTGIEAVRERLKAATSDFPEVADDPVFHDETQEEVETRIDARKEFENRINGTDDFEELTETIYWEIERSRLTDAGKYFLFKKIARKAGVPVGTLKKKQSDDEKSDSANQIDIVEEIIQEQDPENLIHAMGFVWHWDNTGVWKKKDDRQVKGWIQDKLKDQEIDFNKSYVDSILDLFKTETFVPHHRFNIHRDTINCLNGELSWTGETWERHAARRESYRTTQIPIEYDPAATAPQFIKALDEMFRDDPDQKEKIILVCEMFGYCLLSSTEFEKFFMMLGAGANGKSVILSVLTAFPGAGKRISGDARTVGQQIPESAFA